MRQWEPKGEHPLGWYSREVSFGSIWLVLDIWCVDDDAGEWCLSVSNRKIERFRAKDHKKAQIAAETIVAGQLKTAAKICRNQNAD